jgi:hypothetical protein
LPIYVFEIVIEESGLGFKHRGDENRFDEGRYVVRGALILHLSVSPVWLDEKARYAAGVVVVVVLGHGSSSPARFTAGSRRAGLLKFCE